MLQENLRRLRRDYKLTQQDVSDILGIDRSTYTFYETGKTRPSIESIKKLTDTYNVTFGHICGYEKNCPELKLEAPEAVEMCGSDALNGISRNERFLIMAYRSLTKEKKKEFIKNVKDFIKD